MFSFELLWEAFSFPFWRYEVLKRSLVLPEPDQTNHPSHVCSGKQGVKNKMPFIYVPTGIPVDSNENITVPLKPGLWDFYSSFHPRLHKTGIFYFSSRRAVLFQMSVHLTNNDKHFMAAAVQKLWMLKPFSLAEYLSQSSCRKFLGGLLGSVLETIISSVWMNGLARKSI